MDFVRSWSKYVVTIASAVEHGSHLGRCRGHERSDNAPEYTFVFVKKLNNEVHGKIKNTLYLQSSL